MSPSHRLLLGPAVLLVSAALGSACSSSSSGGNGSGADAGGSSSSGSSSGGSSSSGSDSGADPFVGSWVCTGTDMLTFTMPSGAKPENNPYTTDVTVVSTGSGTQTATGEAADGGPSCAIQEDVSGNGASVVSGGQSCTSSNGAVLVYTGGTSTLLSPTSYSTTRVFTFSGMVPYTPDGGTTTMIEVAGSGTSSGTCTKQ
jgi:hypothetical protein